MNSTTEELVIKLFNENTAKGINLGDPRHPVKKLIRWTRNEAIRGVAGSSPVPLLGAVVVEVRLVELGKETGPAIKTKFKVCRQGTTDWGRMDIRWKSVGL